METAQSPKKRALPPPRARKSIAHISALAVRNEKENVTVNLAVPSTSAQGNVTAKKSRSKSIGPGGLDALKEDAGNRRQSAAIPSVKSILKPTVSISPVQRNSRRSKSRSLSPKKSTPEKMKNDLSMLGSPDGSSESIASKSGLVSSSQYRTRIVVRSEEEQHAAAKERERHELSAHKEARRKSLANRRVSFAPEATLHTWDVVELPEDSTVSSASTNLTRRASALSAIAASPFPLPSPTPNLVASEPPSTPPTQIEEIKVADSPSHQRDLHQKKNRRSSVIPPMNFNDPNEFSSSPCSRTSVNDIDEEIQMLKAAEEGNDNSNSDDNDSIEGESTMAGIDPGELSAHSHEDSSTGSSFRLEEALRLAARQAGTQGIEYDENGDISMELADDEITSAFQPWVKESKRISQVRASMALQEDENVNPFSPAFKASATEVSVVDETENTMEFTRSVGAILTDINRRQSVPDEHLQLASVSAKRSNAGGHRRSSGNTSVFGDETMDLTIAMGAIHQNQLALSSPQPVEGLGSCDEDEELSMELTSAIGGLLERFRVPRNETSIHNENYSLGREFPDAKNSACSEGVLPAEETGILMTAGGSLSSITEQTEPPEDQTMEMDVTTAIGAILCQELSASKMSKSKLLLETPRDDGHPNSPPFSRSLPSSSRPSNHIAIMTSETGSPSLMSAQRRTNMKKIPSQRQSTTPRSASRQSGSTTKVSTPSKQHSHNILSPITPTRTPSSRAVLRKPVSPKRTPKAEPQHKSPASQKIQAVQLFNKDPYSGEATPTIVLKPPLRRSSGVGIDRPGLGSPRVTALLDRRQSIGKDAETFKLQKEGSKSVAFEDPQVIRDDLQKRDVLDENSVFEQAALKDDINDQSFGEERDTTANLKDLIESLTPRKKKLNGRKSLHVGAAKGLLGKRPVELDEDDDDDLTPKRLKGREGSPVKKIRLPAPPSKNQTTGRITRSARRSLEETAGNANIITPTQVGKSSASKSQKDEGITEAENPFGGKKMLDTFQDIVAPQYADEGKSNATINRVHLQHFLNMTSIRFIELTTTKRRLTVIPNSTSENAGDKPAGLEDTAVTGRKGSKLEQCVVAGACTIPMLELYQHSCRELKKYIAEGRSIVREIEADTYEENPPLFREYIEAPPEAKSIMDNQFKNVKTHARLLSKAMWYEWRMKLLDSLKEGLIKISDEMDGDDDSLVQQEKILAPILPNLVHQHEQLESEKHVLQARADEFANDDQEELKETRVELVQIEKEIEAERKVLAELQDEFRQQEERIEYAVDQRQHCLEQIEGAEKVRLEGRGWSPSEIASLQARVSDLEKAHNWTISSANGTSLTMTYRHTLQLYFTPASFMRNMAVAPSTNNIDDSPISLTYIGDAWDYKSQPLSTEKRFFLQIMQAHLQCLPQARTKIKDLLKFVSYNWEAACLISEEIRILGISYITEATILLDEVMAIKAVLILRDMKTKVHVRFEVKVKSDENAVELDVNVHPTATVIYGEELKEKKMAEFLQQKIGGKNDKLDSGNVGVWARAGLELQERLIARGRK